MAPYLKVADYVIGKKHLQALPYWLPSLASYGAILGVAFIWIYDFEPVMKKIPFVRSRFGYPYEDDKRVYIKPKYEV